jgi:hypothetical protein
LGLSAILAALFRSGQGRDGLWDFLGKRAASRDRVKLEEARNRGTQEAIAALPPGAVLREGGPDWHREVSIPDRPPPPAVIGLASIQPVVMPPRPPQIEEPPGQSGETQGQPSS